MAPSLGPGPLKTIGPDPFDSLLGLISRPDDEAWALYPNRLRPLIGKREVHTFFGLVVRLALV